MLQKAVRRLEGTGIHSQGQFSAIFSAQVQLGAELDAVSRRRNEEIERGEYLEYQFGWTLSRREKVMTRERVSLAASLSLP